MSFVSMQYLRAMAAYVRAHVLASYHEGFHHPRKTSAVLVSLAPGTLEGSPQFDHLTGFNF